MRSIAIFVLFAGSLLAQQPTDYQRAMQLGVRALATRNYDEAVAAFQRAVDLAPTEIGPRVNLAAALMRQYDPGSTSAANLAIANRCHLEFRRAFDLDPNNWTIPVSIGVLLFGEASGAADRRAGVRLLEESREWYRKALAIDPQSRDYWSWMVRDAWSRWYTDYNGPLFK